MTCIFFRPTLVRLVPKDEAMAIRQAFRQVSADFKNHAMRITTTEAREYGGDRECLPERLETYQTHHIVPVALGGGNAFDNLAWVDPVLHNWFHNFMADQTRGMKAGDERQITIPVKRGLIWRYET